MNDVSSWMSQACLKQYNDLIEEADELDKGKGKGKGKGKQTGKGKGKQRKGKGKEKRSAGKPVGTRHGPRQRAQQIKNSRFNKVISDLACKKTFFMSLVRHPSYLSAEGIRDLLKSLTELMQTRKYKDMVRDSAKKTEAESKLKRRCHQVRLAVKRGRHDHENHVQSELAHKYASGELQHELMQAEAAYTRKKHTGLVTLLKPPESH